MKGFRLIFTAILATLVSQASFADDLSDTARVATRRTTNTTVPATSRQKQTSDTKTTNNNSRISSGRDSSVTRDRSTAQQNTVRTVATNKSIVSRATGIVTNRKNATPGRTITSRSTTPIIPVSTSARTATTGRSAITPTRNAQNATKSNKQRARATNTSTARSATSTNDITSRDFKSCRDVFHSCMDEFCANKDATLKRCACSARAREFDGMKKQLELVEDKLLDFSQRLLTVSMDKEDAAVLNQATEGELAYSQKDQSKSKQLLDDIAKKLNTSFNNSNFDQSLNAISLSLNTDTAFDNIDSLMGASTTTKSGTALYSAALPICREMALEVCTPEDLTIAESGYQMTIEQDCNTVAKTYAAQNDQARTKILESSALLDISRLDVHQKRNSDDILTCKKKMLDMLTDSTVCGTDMSKCLDISGRYINPTTGEAILTENLVDLSQLITRPGPDEKWTDAPGNETFVLFLKNKKKFIEPATENCQNIADSVWNDFIEDALAQIKLAQDAKLEQVRQSCTTLTTQCLDKTFESVSEFDARALSIFGVSADKTVNAMCSDVRTACNALLESTYGDTSWNTGMSEIITDKTYATILSTCREVGRQCIIQSCKSISGNFGLCENIDTSVNRKSIISRHSCWDDILKCVADAGETTINTIMEQQGRTIAQNTPIAEYETFGDIYQELYGFNRNSVTLLSDNTDPEQTPYTSIYDWCSADLDDNASEFDWQVCRITEQIWGNCEQAPTAELSSGYHNKILVNYNSTDNNNETLLSWFARNTGTENNSESCRDTTCGFGTRNVNGICVSESDFTSDNMYCPITNNHFTVTDNLTNCCSEPGVLSNNGLCCQNGASIIKIQNATSYARTADAIDDSEIMYMCAFGEFRSAYAITTDARGLLVCISNKASEKEAIEYTTENITCNGYFVYLHENGVHVMPTKTDGIENYYNTEDSCSGTLCTTCTYNSGTWSSTDDATECQNPTNWHVKYNL